MGLERPDGGVQFNEPCIISLELNEPENVQEKVILTVRGGGGL